jgi:hypothetical protein
MVTVAPNLSKRHAPDAAAVVRAVTAIVGTVVGLTFLFGFGNVLNLALRLGVPTWVAPLIAPAVDLSVLGLLLGIRHLALGGACSETMRPARRLLIFASVVTMALNVSEPLVAGQVGKAAFDAVGPLLLIGWAEVGPGFLLAIGTASTTGRPVGNRTTIAVAPDGTTGSDTPDKDGNPSVGGRRSGTVLEPGLLKRAYRADEDHRRDTGRPISAERLRTELRVGSTSARRLVAAVRAAQPMTGEDDEL